HNTHTTHTHTHTHTLARTHAHTHTHTHTHSHTHTHPHTPQSLYPRHHTPPHTPPPRPPTHLAGIMGYDSPPHHPTPHRHRPLMALALQRETVGTKQRHPAHLLPRGGVEERREGGAREC